MRPVSVLCWGVLLLGIVGCGNHHQSLFLKEGESRVVTIRLQVNGSLNYFEETWLRTLEPNFPSTGFVFKESSRMGDYFYYFKGTVRGPIDLEKWADDIEAVVRKKPGVIGVKFSS